jgi:hypothetical protein
VGLRLRVALGGQLRRATQYAIQINDGDERRTTHTFNRIQAETPNRKAVSISQNTVSCPSIDPLGSPDQPDLTEFAWILGGKFCVYNVVRSRPSPGRCQHSLVAQGVDTTYAGLRAESVSTFLSCVQAGSTLTLSAPNLESGPTSVNSSNAGRIIILGGRITTWTGSTAAVNWIQ